MNRTKLSILALLLTWSTASILFGCVPQERQETKPSKKNKTLAKRGISQGFILKFKRDIYRDIVNASFSTQMVTDDFALYPSSARITLRKWLTKKLEKLHGRQSCNVFRFLVSVPNKLYGESNIIERMDCRNLPGTELLRGQVGKQDIRRSNFSEVNMNFVNLNKSMLHQVSWNNTSLQYANFERVVIINNDFDSANLWNANFEESSIHDAFFKNAMLVRASLARSVTYDLVFRGARMDYADFTTTELHNADFQNAKLWSVSFRLAHLRDAKLSKADWYKPNLSGALLGMVNAWRLAQNKHVARHIIKAHCLPIFAFSLPSMSRKFYTGPAASCREWHVQNYLAQVNLEHSRKEFSEKKQKRPKYCPEQLQGPIVSVLLNSYQGTSSKKHQQRANEYCSRLRAIAKETLSPKKPVSAPTSAPVSNPVSKPTTQKATK